MSALAEQRDVDLLNAALGYARRGWRIFPVKPRGKTPLTKHGLKDATTDEAAIQAWWKQWPDANIGYATGESIVVVDVDELGSWTDLLDEANERAPNTSRVATSSGWHLYFRTAEVIRNSAGKLKPGLDIRGDGGYVLLPPSIHPDGTVYRWEKNGAPDELPAWLRERLTVTPKQREPWPHRGLRLDEAGTPYGLAALEDETRTVATAPEGTRNHTLNVAAFKLGCLVAGGEIDEYDARTALMQAALTSGLPEKEAEATIKSGFEAGLDQPRQAPPRQRAGGVRTRGVPSAEPTVEDMAAYAALRHEETNGQVDEVEFAAELPGLDFRAVPAETFAAADVEMADPLIGGADTRLMPASSTSVYYGEGGSGKTTLTVDLACHLAAGVDWLGFPITQPVRVMLLENEGPIDEYRLKLRRKLATWQGPALGGRLLIHEAPWGRVDLRNDDILERVAAQLRQHQIDVLIAGPIRRLGLEGGGTPAETVAYMQLLDRVRHLSGRPVAIVNVHHENKGGDISGAFEAEFDTVVQVKADGRDRTQLVFRKSRWSSKIHRARMTLGWVLASEGFGVLESDLDAPSPAARDEGSTTALEWLTKYVNEHPGIARGKAETAYHEAHGNRGRNLARRVIDTQLALAAASFEGADFEGTGETPHTLAAGPGDTKHGTYLYPANHALSPLAATPNGETGETPQTLDSTAALATSPPPIEEAAAGETPARAAT